MSGIEITSPANPPIAGGGASKAEVAAEKTRAEAVEAEKLAKTENLKDLASAATARTNLGLGSAAVEPTTAFDAKGAAAAEQARAETAEATKITSPSGSNEDLLVRSGAGWARLAVGSNGQQLIVRSDGTVKWVEPAEYNVKGWGAAGNDLADDFPAFRSAWEAATAAAVAGPGGYVIRVPSGAYRLNRASEGGAPALYIPANMQGRVIIKGAGRGSTTIRLTSNVASFLNSATTEMGQTIRNVEVEDLTIDGKSVTGSGTGLLFNISVNAGNVDSVAARRVEGIGGGPNTNNRRWVSVNVTRNDPFGVPFSTTLETALETTGATTVAVAATTIPGASAGMQFTIGTGEEEETLTIVSVSGKIVTVKAPGTTKTHIVGAAIKLLPITENYITNVHCQDCNFGWGPGGEATGGGATGIYVGAFCSPSQSENDVAYYNQTNPAALVRIDQIRMERVRWRATAAPTGFFVSAGIQVGGDGYAQKVDLVDCSCRDAGDVNYEIDSCLDLTARGCYGENAWNENFFFANNHGGLTWPARQRMRFVDCTSVVSNSNLLTAPFAGYSRHGTSFGDIIFQNCVYKHTSTRFLNGAGTSEANPSSGAFRLTGKWRRASFLGCSAIYDGLALEATANNFTTTPIGILIQQMGGTSAVVVRDFAMEMNGTAKQGSFTGCAVQADCVKIDTAANLTLTVDGVIPRSNFQTLDSIQFRFRELNLNTTAGTMAETWSGIPNSLTTQYILDTGTLSDLKQEATFLASVANHTTRKSFRIWNGLFIKNQPADQVGKTMDGSIYVEAKVAATSVANTELIARLRVSDAGNSEVRARLVDEAGATKLLIEKVVEGTPTVLAEETLTRITTNQVIGVRLKQQGNILVADYYSSPAKSPAISEKGTVTKEWTLAGTDRNLFGATGLPGYVGWGWTPAESTATFILIRYDHVHVIGGSVDRLIPAGNEKTVTSTAGIVFNANHELLRFRGKLRCRNWLHETIKKDSPVDISGPDTTQKSEVDTTGCLLAEPVAAGNITVGSSPFTYTNSDMVQEDVEIMGGTLSAIELTREGVTTSIATVAITAIIRLMPGDALKVTYTLAPTMRKWPAY